jgi:energy-coupling factor transport system permease protein
MHTLAWMAWVAMVMTIALSTTNPLYLCVILLGILLVAAVAPRTGTAVAGFRALLVLGSGLFAVSLAIAVVNGGYGSHVLFTVPGPDVPRWLGGLRIGGPVAAEGLVAATVRGLAILCVLLGFAVFNGAVSAHRVLGTAPAALFHAGLVVTVGLTSLPSSIEDIRRIREVQALRGATAGLRQLPALVVPAVINGLERSMRLAEAMEARGYAWSPPPARWSRPLAAASAPLLLGGAWAWFSYENARPFAAVAFVAGAGAIAAWAWSAARSRRTTQLAPEPLTLADGLAIGGSIVLAFLALAGRSPGWVDLAYNPFAGLGWPAFSPPGAALALAVAWPALRLTIAPAGEIPRTVREPASGPFPP